MGTAMKARPDALLYSESEPFGDLEEKYPIFPSLYQDRMWPSVVKEEVTTSSQPNISSNPMPNQTSISFESTTAPLVFPKIKEHKTTSFRSLKKWRGVVLEVFEDSFLAKLIDMDEETLDEEAEILISEISDEDIKLLRKGGVFYWNIGYHKSSWGQIKRASMIRFRRLPQWTGKEIEEAKKKAENTLKALGLGDEKAGWTAF